MAAIPELMIRSGMVADGLAGEPRVADIAIGDDRILAVGRSCPW
jgi:N-acyl-D-aspartate/D-glutamate deacylase